MQKRQGTPATEQPVCVDDYERLAEQCLDANAWAYISGGAGDETTMRWNRDAFRRHAILPRVLRRASAPSTALDLFGKRLAHPIIVAPLAHQAMIHQDAEIGTALAAAAQDALMILSTLATAPYRDVITANGNACRWFQLYVQGSRDDTLKLVRKAEDAGAEAIVLTVDAPLAGVRNREQRVNFHLPPHVLAALARNRPPKAPRPEENDPDFIFREFLRTAPDWDYVRWLRHNTALPLILKGIASPADARIARECGVDGVIVSNHGGRTLDTIPATLDLLPAVVAAVGGSMPVLMDGGIRRGTDIFKALALGASAVLIGRPILFGLAVNGAMGVSHVLRILRDEFAIAMLLSGAMTVADITTECLTDARQS